MLTCDTRGTGCVAAGATAAIDFAGSAHDCTSAAPKIRKNMPEKVNINAIIRNTIPHSDCDPCNCFTFYSFSFEHSTTHVFGVHFI
jgi:hypothetical protein